MSKKNKPLVTVHHYTVMVHGKTNEALALAELLVDTKNPEFWEATGGLIDIGWDAACKDYENFVEIAQANQLSCPRVYFRTITEPEYESYEEMEVLPVMRLEAKLRQKRDDVLWLKENET